MSSAFQNRLVGTIVIVALLVIFLPEFLDGKKESHQDKFQTIPTAPTYNIPIADIHFPEEEYQTLSSQNELSDEVALDEHFENATKLNTDAIDVEIEPEPEPKADESNLVIDVTATNTQLKKEQSQFEHPAWVIQLGSFKHQKNVTILLETLKREGYIAFTKPIETKSGPLTKVFVGPDLEKEKLNKLIPELQKLTRLSGKLAVYQPAN
ncbi:SPOR domain-containing protein [Algibacillus agarilyticus]|uniref:SPOR domain-containing protein n=1 Tax=Algibacillus agarilyticus TaxID=2234133 RepID=UPI0013007F01|nr:SPOR domain-containing protein [Algibacillus agarilyticus]